MVYNDCMKLRDDKIILTLLLVVAVLSVTVFFVFQRNSYSKDIVKLEIDGPDKAEPGEEISYEVKYKNRGGTTLEDVVMVFKYPDNSVSIDEEGRRIEMELDELSPGESESFEFKSRVFGAKGEELEFKVSMSYKAKGLQATYDSEASIVTKIKDVPLSLVFDMPSKVTMNQEVGMVLNYYSSLDWAISGLGIRLEYPSGFEVSDSGEGSIGGGEWMIPVLNKSEGGRIEVKGRFKEEVGGIGDVRAQLGVWIDDRFIVLEEEIKEVVVIKPKIVLSQYINGDADRSVSSGDLLHYELVFKNTGNSSFRDLSLVSRLTGPLNWDTLRSDDGEVLSDGVVQWNSSDELRDLDSGEEGRVEFWVEVSDSSAIKSLRSPVLVNSITLADIDFTFQTRVNSVSSFSQRGYYEDEVFGNSGPIPPEVGKDTTYTIIWRVENYSNALEDAKVRATLPAGVLLSGRVFPEESRGQIAFDSKSREVLWSVGGVPAGSGAGLPAQTIVFQIELEPQDGQRGEVVPLVGEATFTATDRWTDRSIETESDMIDSTLPHDKTIDEDDGIVD